MMRVIDVKLKSCWYKSLITYTVIRHYSVGWHNST